MPVARGFDIGRHAQMVPPDGGISPVRAKLRAQALTTVREDELVKAAYSYQIVPLDGPAAPLLRAGGESLGAPWLLPASGQLTALACCACTLGPAFERRVSELFAQRRPSLAMALDELGNELLFDISRRAQDRMHAEVTRRGLSMAGELRQVFSGLEVARQPSVFSRRIDFVGARGVVHMPQFNGKQDGMPVTAAPTCAAPATVSE